MKIKEFKAGDEVIVIIGHNLNRNTIKDIRHGVIVSFIRGWECYRGRYRVNIGDSEVLVFGEYIFASKQDPELHAFIKDLKSKRQQSVYFEIGRLKYAQEQLEKIQSFEKFINEVEECTDQSHTKELTHHPQQDVH